MTSILSLCDEISSRSNPITTSGGGKRKQEELQQEDYQQDVHNKQQRQHIPSNEMDRLGMDGDTESHQPIVDNKQQPQQQPHTPQSDDMDCIGMDTADTQFASEEVKIEENVGIKKVPYESPCPIFPYYNPEAKYVLVENMVLVVRCCGIG